MDFVSQYMSGDHYDLKNVKLVVHMIDYVDNKHVAWSQQQVITELIQENMQYKIITHIIYMVKQ